LAELARAAGDDFPDAVKTVLPLLVPLGQADMFLHETPEDAADPATPRLYRKFPEAYLAMLDRLIARDTRSAPYVLVPSFVSWRRQSLGYDRILAGDA
jgi:hypothetical protein